LVDLALFAKSFSFAHVTKGVGFLLGYLAIFLIGIKQTLGK